MSSFGFALRQKVKMLSQNVYLPAVYEACRFQKVDPNLVIFADAHHNARPAAMDLLYHRLKKDGRFHIVQMYCDYGTASKKKVLQHMTVFMRLYAKAGFVVICDNFLPVASCKKKPGTKVIQLWHACGCYKKFGYDAPDDIPADYHGEVFRNIDLVTVSSKAAVRPFCRAMHLTEEQVRPLGVSRTDLYFSEKWRARCASRFRERYPEVYGKIIVLWAPTFRGNAGVPELLDLDVGKLQQELGDSYLVLTRLHPHMKQAQKESAHDCPIPTEEPYPVVDVLIADYSSLIYEYLLFGGQVVLYAPDVEEYRKRRGFYMDIDEIPGEIVTDPVSLADAVRQAAEHTRSQKDRPRDLFLMKYMGACDGHVTERIYSWMNGGCQRRTDIFDYK